MKDRIKKLIRQLEKEIEVSLYLTGDKRWASTGSDYHVQCRKEQQKLRNDNRKVIKELKKILTC